MNTLHLNIKAFSMSSKEKLHIDKDTPTNQSLIGRFQQQYQANVRVFCEECAIPLTQSTAVLSGEGVHCVGCFANFPSFPSEYMMKPKPHTAIIYPSWSCRDEMMLLSALIDLGFGNWLHIKDYMDYNQSSFLVDQIQNHYNECYLHSPSFLPCLLPQPLPLNRTPTLKLTNPSQTHSKEELRTHKRLPEPTAQSTLKPKGQATSYNKRRNQFEVFEYDYEAESTLAELEFGQEEEEEETILKFNIIKDYNRRLDERILRRHFVVEHRLLDAQYQLQTKGLHSPFLIPFMRFIPSHATYTHLSQALTQAHSYTTLSTFLIKLRNKGIKDIQSVCQYVAGKRKRDKNTSHQPRKVFVMEGGEFKDIQGNVLKIQK